MRKSKETTEGNLGVMGALLLAICFIILLPLLVTGGDLFRILSELQYAGIDSSYLIVSYLLALAITGIPGIILLSMDLLRGRARERRMRELEDQWEELQEQLSKGVITQKAYEQRRDELLEKWQS